MPESISLANVDCEDLVDELVDRMDLDGDEARKFKMRCMERAGYRAEPMYVKDTTADVDDDSDIYSQRFPRRRSGSGSKAGTDSTSKSSSRSRKSDDEDWYNQ